DGANVARLDQIRNGANRVLDRYSRIESCRPVDVDVIDAQTREAVDEKVSDRYRPGVDAAPTTVRATESAKLHREQRGIATVTQRPADQHFVMAGAIEIAGVQERDALIER